MNRQANATAHSSDQHEAAILDQFKRQGVPFAASTIIRNQELLNRIL